MPVYEYSCSVCGKRFETHFSFDEDRKNIHCPSGHTQVRRIYNSVPIVFKGSGFYVTDHKNISSGDIGKP
jgi:putative FmdB family regulatory protein